MVVVITYSNKATLKRMSLSLVWRVSTEDSLQRSRRPKLPTAKITELSSSYCLIPTLCGLSRILERVTQPKIAFLIKKRKKMRTRNSTIRC